MLFHIRKPQKLDKLALFPRKETCPSHQLCPSQRALIAAWRHWGVGVILMWGHHPKRQELVPLPLPLWLCRMTWKCCRKFHSPVKLDAFGQVRLSYTRMAMASASLSAMAASLSNTDRPWAFLDSSHLSCSTETWGQMIYVPRLQRVFQVATHHSTPTLPWPHTTHPVVMAI